MQQQQQQQMMPAMPPAIMTTDQIQKCLDENKKLILAILENQNLGKLTECAQYQNQLQKNLMYLAAVADAQPQVTTTPPQTGHMQTAPHPAMQQGAYFMPHPQAATAASMGQQPVMFPPKAPMQYNSPHQMQDQQQQLQQLHPQPGPMGMRPVGMHYPIHPDALTTTITGGGGVGGASGGLPSGGSKQAGPVGGTSGGGAEEPK
ncbi:unnamed protein product [Rhodiola kirilowii]